MAEKNRNYILERCYTLYDQEGFYDEWDATYFENAIKQLSSVGARFEVEVDQSMYHPHHVAKQVVYVTVYCKKNTSKAYKKAIFLGYCEKERYEE